MFDNRKIRQIRHMPEGNNIVLIWVMLLTIAGRCNAGGMIFLTENIPYTLESLAVEMEFDQTVVKLAIDILQKFGMIICDENAFFITNWEEYQNIEGLDKIREQTRQRVARYRENRKALIGNVTSNATVTPCNATDKEIEEEKELDKEERVRNRVTPSNEGVYADKPPRTRFTPPSVEEVRAYCIESGHKVDAQHFVDYYTSNGWMVGKNKMKDWKAAVRTWARKDTKQEKKTNNIFLEILEDEQNGQTTNGFNPFCT